MPKLKDEQIKQAFQAYLQPDETLNHWAFGVKQPSIYLIIALVALFVLPGIIAIMFMTKNYLIGLTNKRLIVLEVKSITDSGVKNMVEYDLAELKTMKVEANTGPIFTKIKISDPGKPFEAKFHRAFSKDNRTHAVAISDAIKS